MSSEARNKLRAQGYAEYSKHKKESCEECGAKGSWWAGDYLVRRNRLITVHHIDGDVTNNHPSNLQTLCRKCHDKKHNK